MRDYRVIFLSDGTATYDLSDTEWGTISADEIQRFVLAILAYRFAQVSSVGDIINQLS
jgi:ureidoacrylate peracid hydrolase